MSRNPTRPYWPGPVPQTPESLSAYLEYELNRIRQALSADPVSFSAVNPGGTLAISGTVAWVNPLVGISPDWDIPGGQMVDGVWTVPQDGLYQVQGQFEVAPFGSGNKSYWAAVRLRINGGAWITSTAGGADDVPLTVTKATLQVLQAGDVVDVEVGAEHSQFSGSSAYTFRWSAVRLSA